ncbi:hypothetical protein Lal_00000798 [Lupinus albus]|nr:hypothetical protein Lal_00000798 [Lupinus albus]
MIGNWSMISLGKGFYDLSLPSKEDMRSSLKPGFFRLFLWTPDFIPSQQILSHTQCWIKIHNLPQEYWSPRIIFSITGGIGTLMALDKATNSRSLILVEREGVAKPKVKKTMLVEKDTRVKETNANDLVINLEFDNRLEVNASELEKLELTPDRMCLLDNVNEVLNNSVENNSVEEVDSNSMSDNIVVQETAELVNQAAANDMRIVGKLWADEEKEEVDEEFTHVLNKSQKKKMNKKDQYGKIYQTRRGEIAGGWETLILDWF